jgi:hypothetical protein
VNPPERLYLEVNAPPMAFTGTDLISGDDRELVITTSDAGCAPAAPDWFLDGCARVQLGVTHGELVMPMSTTLGGAGEPDGLHSGGAVVESSQNGDGTGLSVNLNGTEAQLNSALADLTYEPDQDYEYHGGNPETLEIELVNGDPADPGNFTYGVEIRVEQVNDWPTLTVPAGPYNVAGGSTTDIPVVPPARANGEFYV